MPEQGHGVVCRTPSKRTGPEGGCPTKGRGERKGKKARKAAQASRTGKNNGNFGVFDVNRSYRNGGGERAMTYDEFSQSTETTLSQEAFQRIEEVYMAYDRFNTKSAMYCFYGTYGMEGIDALYNQLCPMKQMHEQLAYLQAEFKRRSMLYGISIK
jgi:YD repeat-containing protein